MPRRDLLMAACGLFLLGIGQVSSPGDPAQPDASTVHASLTHTRPFAMTNPLDSRFQPDGVPLVVPVQREISI